MCSLFLRNFLKISRVHAFHSRRHLYTPASLAIDGFLSSRNTQKYIITDMEEYRNHIRDCLEGANDYLVLTDDLKKFLRVAETDEDVELLREMLKRLSRQNDVIRFQRFAFGPEVMRLLHVLKKPYDAISFVENEEFLPVMNHLSTYIILLNMLFTHQMYDDVVRLFLMITERQCISGTYCSQMVVIFFGACYKLNTPKYYEEAKEVWQKLIAIGYNCPYRAVWFFKMLAYLQGDLVVAIEASVGKEDSVLMCIKLMALTDKKRYLDVIHTLRSFLYKDRPQWFQVYITQDTVNYLLDNFKEADEGIQRSLSKLIHDFKVQGFIKSTDIDTLLCEPIEYKGKRKTPGTRRFV